MNVMLKDILWGVFSLIGVSFLVYFTCITKKRKNDERWQLIVAKANSLTLNLVLAVSIAMVFVILNIPLDGQQLRRILVGYCAALPFVIYVLKLVLLLMYDHQL
ncbi:hypothetical protein PT287_05205 [Lactobacillus sp. ESL0679]|uniref:hypothetical protein n=1 Tax=Lactobacillus sp. ESL0679 TaxID=2983209 RepID=UPI0023FA4514|nr:hypothetical protein [Lactobacillus sp. ESL0679]MDF7682923.1 hypothetical protein [Lactobacillus sp. ESL0679]